MNEIISVPNHKPLKRVKGVEVKLQKLQTRASDGGEWPTSHSFCPFSHGTRWIRGYRGFRTKPDAMAKRNVLNYAAGGQTPTVQ
jgi:hypothetical protein